MQPIMPSLCTSRFAQQPACGKDAATLRYPDLNRTAQHWAGYPEVVLKTTENALVTATAQAAPTNVYPYNAVVRITDQIGQSFWQGSGVLISPDEVLTADHVSYRSGADGGVAVNIDVAPAYQNGDAPLGHYSGTVTHYFEITDEPYIGAADIQTDYSIIHLSMPVVGGSVMQVTPDYAGGAVHVTGYPISAGGVMIDDVQTVNTDPNYSIYEGTSLGAGSSGGPVWTYGADGKANVVGLVSAESGTTAFDMKLTAAKAAQIAAWVKQDDGGVATTPAVAVYDTTTGKSVADTFSQPYTGPVPGLQTQFVDITPDSLNIAASAPNMFIHTGSGNDAVRLLGGTNVVDGGSGSNFMVGGIGTDTFFVDARGVTANTWSTVSGFHSGDAATLWGISPTSFAISWADSAGAVGAKGLTLFAGTAGHPNTALTFAGLTQADLASGRVTASFGHNGGGDYLLVRAV